MQTSEVRCFAPLPETGSCAKARRSHRGWLRPSSVTGAFEQRNRSGHLWATRPFGKWKPQTGATVFLVAPLLAPTKGYLGRGSSDVPAFFAARSLVSWPCRLWARSTLFWFGLRSEQCSQEVGHAKIRGRLTWKCVLNKTQHAVALARGAWSDVASGQGQRRVRKGSMVASWMKKTAKMMYTALKQMRQTCRCMLIPHTRAKNNAAQMVTVGMGDGIRAASHRKTSEASLCGLCSKAKTHCSSLHSRYSSGFSSKRYPPQSWRRPSTASL